jgi:2'-5' RNA ligase
MSRYSEEGNKPMRLFAGLDVPYEMRRNLELLLQLLKPKARISWSPLANLHVTTKFIGEWPEDRLEELKQALEAVPRPGPLRIGIRGVGWFPNPHHPKVFFAVIQAPPALAELAKATDTVCAGLGIAPETKPYQPHLTLARIRHEEILFEVKKAIADLPSVDFGAYEARNFHLYRSTLQAGGSIYTKLASYSLSA